MKTNEIYEKIADIICEKLEQGVNPWVKPWKSVYKQDGKRHPECLAYNYFRGVYHGINQALLGNGYFVSMEDIKAHKMKLKKGSKGNFVVFFNYFERRASGKEKESGYEDRDGYRYYNSNPNVAFYYSNEKQDYVEKHPNLKYYYVYNILDCKNVPNMEDFTNVEGENDMDISTNEEIEQIVENYLQKSRTAIDYSYSDEAFYEPSGDYIIVPRKNQFRSVNNYYQTLFHELSHSTGKAKLLNREGVVKHDSFGSQLYSKEELIAEISSAYCIGYLGVYDDNVMCNSVAYLKSWATNIKSNKDLKTKIMNATTQAQKAFELILGLNDSDKIFDKLNG